MTLKINSIYKGKVVELNVETVTLPNGERCELEIVHHPGGVAVVAVNDQHQLCLLRQFRHAAGGWIWELPAGRLEPGEAPLASAGRELEEEAGVIAGQWLELGPVYSSPGVFTEVIHLYLARQLTTAQARPERHEVFETHWLERAEVEAMVTRGEIRDAKTLVGLCLAKAHL